MLRAEMFWLLLIQVVAELKLDWTCALLVELANVLDELGGLPQREVRRVRLPKRSRCESQRIKRFVQSLRQAREAMNQHRM
jgi:hypothetical protein